MSRNFPQVAQSTEATGIEVERIGAEEIGAEGIEAEEIEAEETGGQGPEIGISKGIAAALPPVGAAILSEL